MADYMNVEIIEDVLEITEIGIQGAPGLAGIGASVPINFSWGDASPALLATVGAGKHVYAVELIILGAFDGAGTALTIGPLAAPTELMAAAENAPGTIASYETSPNKLYIGATGIYLTITPGAGASAGNGQIRLQIEA